jgi:cation:H+ antiporter
MAPPVAIPLFLASLAVTLAAARSFASRLDRLGLRLGFPEALIGLLTALAADGPEISSALVALAKGAHTVTVGVLVGSNLFNLAAMTGLSAVLAGSVLLPRQVLALEGLVGAAVTVIAATVLVGWLAPGLAAILALCVIVPYVLLVIRGPRVVQRAPLPGGVLTHLELALAQREPMASSARGESRPTHHVLALIAVDVALIVAGSAGMVQASIALADHWQIARTLLGVLILAPLTSIPNAMTAVRLGLARRGSALVGETFNSNTINLAIGVIVPAIFVSLGALQASGKVAIGWLLAMTALTVALLARRGGIRRPGGMLLITVYLGFVVYQLAAG